MEMSACVPSAAQLRSNSLPRTVLLTPWTEIDSALGVLSPTLWLPNRQLARIRRNTTYFVERAPRCGYLLSAAHELSLTRTFGGAVTVCVSYQCVAVLLDFDRDFDAVLRPDEAAILVPNVPQYAPMLGELAGNVFERGLVARCQHPACATCPVSAVCLSGQLIWMVALTVGVPSSSPTKVGSHTSLRNLPLLHADGVLHLHPGFDKTLGVVLRAQKDFSVDVEVRAECFQIVAREVG